jgi:hypothetical protein
VSVVGAGAAPDELELFAAVVELAPELEPLDVLADVPPELEPFDPLLAATPELEPVDAVVLDVTPALELVEAVLAPGADAGLPDAVLEVLPELAAAEVLVDGVTWIEKGGSATEFVPSLAAMTIFGYVPVSDVLGLPESWPVSDPKLAHAGLLLMLNISDVPAGLTERGRKL